MEKPTRFQRVYSRVRRLVLPLLVLLAVAGFLWWRQRPPRVQVTTPVRKDVVTSVVTTGMVETVTISPGSETGGRIDHLFVRQGQTVKEGELLATLDTRELQARLREAETALEAARVKQSATAAEAWRPQLDMAEAALEQARLKVAQARREWRDLQTLADGGAVPRIEADNARQALAAAQLQQREAEARLRQLRLQARGERRQAKVGVDAAQAALETLRAQVARARITAPAAGIVIELHARAGETLAPGAPLLKIARRDGVRIAVQLDEQYLAQVRPGQPARLATDAFPKQTFTGRVEKINPAVDPERGTIKVLIVPEGVPGYLRPDMTLDVNIVTGEYPGMLAVPRTALTGTASRPRVWIVAEDGRAYPREVEPGPSGAAGSEDGTEVPIERGLAANDRVILNPPRLRPGQRVEAIQRR